MLSAVCCQWHSAPPGHDTPFTRAVKSATSALPSGEWGRNSLPEPMTTERADKAIMLAVFFIFKQLLSQSKWTKVKGKSFNFKYKSIIKCLQKSAANCLFGSLQHFLSLTDAYLPFCKGMYFCAWQRLCTQSPIILLGLAISSRRWAAQPAMRAMAKRGVYSCSGKSSML